MVLEIEGGLFGQRDVREQELLKQTDLTVYGDYVKSVQYGSVTMASATSGTAAITAVVVANSIILHLGSSLTTTTATAHGDIMSYMELTNATTVTTNRAGSTGTMISTFCVIEFQANIVKSNQRGTITFLTASATSAINEVNINKTMISYLGQNGGASGSDVDQLDHALANLTLTNSTTITATKASSSSPLNTNINYQLVEFY